MLSIKEHISNQILKTYAKSGALWRIRCFAPSNVMLRLYEIFHLTSFRILHSALSGSVESTGESDGRF